MKKTIGMAILIAASAFGQGGPMIPFQPTYNELKAVLGLTEAQVGQLRDIQQSKTKASQEFFQQMTQKQKQLNDMLSSPNPDPAAIGNLSIELQKLRTQASTPTNTRDAAMAVLTPEQKTKLAKLQEALAMRQAADQAVSLNLLDYPHMPMPFPAIISPAQSK